MAVLTDNKIRPYLGLQKIAEKELQLAGYTNFSGGNTTHEVYIGSGMISDVSDTDGYFRAAPSAGSAAGDIFGGVSLDRVSVTSSDTADGSKLAAAQYGVVGWAVGSLAITDLGAAIYLSDDDTVTTSSTNNYWCGYLLAVDSTYAYVDHRRAFMMTNSAT